MLQRSWLRISVHSHTHNFITAYWHKNIPTSVHLCINTWTNAVTMNLKSDRARLLWHKRSVSMHTHTYIFTYIHIIMSTCKILCTLFQLFECVCVCLCALTYNWLSQSRLCCHRKLVAISGTSSVAGYAQAFSNQLPRLCIYACLFSIATASAWITGWMRKLHT